MLSTWFTSHHNMDVKKEVIISLNESMHHHEHSLCCMPAWTYRRILIKFSLIHIGWDGKIKQLVRL